MHWFSHRHSSSPPGGHAMVSSVAACCVRPVNRDDSAVFRFLSLVTVTFEFGRDFCTVHLTTKVHHPKFNHLEVIVRTNKHTIKQTNKQTQLKTSTSFRYATPVGNQSIMSIHSELLLNTVQTFIYFQQWVTEPSHSQARHVRLLCRNTRVQTN